MAPLTLGILILIICSAMFVTSHESNHHKLMVILMDGFRWDYVEKHNLVNFKRLNTLGARAGYLENDFPTLSYPNYYSLMTGLHTESHGMTGNYMFDKASRGSFLLGHNSEYNNSRWWDGGQPLWVTAEKQGKETAMYYWPGCELSIQATEAKYCQEYSGVTNETHLAASIANGLEKLTKGDTSLAGIYLEQTDHVGHIYGVESTELANTLKAVDTEIGKLIDKLQSLGDEDKVNLIIFSDHGMTPISESRVINLTNILTQDLYVSIMEAVSITSIYTEDATKGQGVYDLLKEHHENMTCYKKADIPERYHYKHGKFVGDVTCVAKLGWTIVHPAYSGFPTKGTANLKGYHGYDNQESDMRGFFYAYGPSFIAGASVNYIRAVDLYNVMCGILDVKPATNNGSLTVISNLLVRSAGSDVRSSILLVAMVTPLLLMFATN